MHTRDGRLLTQATTCSVLQSTKSGDTDTMPSLAKINSAIQRLIPFPVHVTWGQDEPVKIIPQDTNDSKAHWWLSILQHERNFSPDNGFEYAESVEAIRLRLTSKEICIRLTKDSGTLRVYGKDNVRWFKEDLLLVVLDPVTAAIDEQLGLHKYKKLIQRLPTAGGVMDSPGYIYPLWKSQLDRWLHCGMSLVIVTPSLDCTRLQDILLLTAKYLLRQHTFALKLIVREMADETNSELSFDAIKNNAVNKIREVQCVEDQMLQESTKKVKVFHDSRFCSSFICAYKDNEAELLITSASFHGSHFDQPNRDTVFFIKLTKQQLKKDYLHSFSC